MFDPYVGPRKASSLTFTSISPGDDGQIRLVINPANLSGNATLSGVEIRMTSLPALPEKDLSWHTVASYPGILEWNKVAYGQRRFVVAANGALLVSSDQGWTWQPSAGTAPIFFSDVVYGNNTFVAVGWGTKSDPAIFSSRTGLDWTGHSTSSLIRLQAVAFGNERFVGVGNGLIAMSEDAEHWQTTTEVSSADLANIVFGNGQFLVPENLNSWLSSIDGKSWTRFQPKLPPLDPSCVVNCSTNAYCCPFVSKIVCATNCLSWTELWGLASVGDRFVASIESSDQEVALVTAIDGREWLINPSFPIKSVLAGGQSLLSLNDELILKSPLQRSGDLEVWRSFSWPRYPEETVQNLSFQNWSGAFGDGNYVVVGRRSSRPFIAAGDSWDLLKRVDRPALPDVRPRVASSGSLLVIVNPYLDRPIPLLVSRDGGASFGPVDLPAVSNALRAIAHRDHQFIAVGDGGIIVASNGGERWNLVPSGVADNLLSIACSSNRWIAVGEHGTIIVSQDGARFFATPSATGVQLNSVTAGNEGFVAVGAAGTVLHSTDGSNWIAGQAGNVDLYGVAFGNGKFVAAGAFGLAQVSTNAVDWSSSRAMTVDAGDVVFASGYFLAIARGGTEASLSTDGLNWTATSLPSGTTSAFADGAEFWVSGSSSNNFVARSSLKAPQIELASTLDGSGRFSLAFEATLPGTYQILSAADLKGEWRTEAVLTSELNRQMTWTATNLTTRTFFRVQSE